MNKKISKRRNPYPKMGDVMVSGKLVVLASGYGNQSIGYPCFAGVVIIASEADAEGMPVGFYSRTWTLDAFLKTTLKINLH